MNSRYIFYVDSAELVNEDWIWWIEGKVGVKHYS